MNIKIFSLKHTITSHTDYIVKSEWMNLKPSSQYDAERRVALRRVATRRVVHNFCAHARVRRTATTPIARVFGSKYKIYD